MQYIKSKIDTLLKEKKKKMPDFLEAIEMSENGYYAAIRNESMKIATLEKAADFFGVSTAYFFGGPSEPKNKSTSKAKVVFELDLDDTDILNLKLKNRVLEMAKNL